VEEVPKQEILIVMGDWNAKIGTENSGWEKVMGKFGYGVRNERGEKLTRLGVEGTRMAYQQAIKERLETQEEHGAQRKERDS